MDNKTGDTQDDVRAAREMASKEDVAQSIQAAAPADAFDAFMHSAAARLRQIEAVIGLAEPLVNEAAHVAGMVYPQAAPILSRVADVEAAAADASSVANAALDGLTSQLRTMGGDGHSTLAHVEKIGSVVSAILAALHTAFADHPTLPTDLPARNVLSPLRTRAS